MDYELLSYALRSKQRRAIIISLERPKTPTQIAHETKLSTAHVSRTLREFCSKKIAKCETPKAKIGRVYRLTKKGKEILKNLK
jgi:DNA-binding MarR family transcriptional regulator